MNFTKVKSIFSSSIRFVAIAFACTLILFSNGVPAFAGGTPTDPREGSARLDSLQQKAEEILQKPPIGMKETQAEANKGINEIQGDSDANDMSRPSNSRQVKSAAERVTEALEKVTGKE
ncbi:MAG: hypothetical protein KME15_07445 [Drouetiella hepatica Uher 2000/2452]|jgi:hypothetical protein|uniref:Low temperature-induced protein n=1 Tax=Drouetiella hepatica Uher 2000/2452 TaxID=904376 RepID=A0A951ULT3_9CYAN|nr:hypothetical protein [Drouetiella hepatica Uher 2000/2452]